jgi:hypothetical protein
MGCTGVYPCASSRETRCCASCSPGNSDERSLLRDRFREQVTSRLTALLTGPEPALRAELVAGQLLGLGGTLSLHPSGAGSLATPEHLADLYAPALQRLVTG